MIQSHHLPSPSMGEGWVGVEICNNFALTHSAPHPLASLAPSPTGGEGFHVPRFI